MISVLCFFLGGFVGAYAAWYYWLHHEQPKIEFKVDPAVLNLINGAMVSAWLDKEGLMWMPKGVEFKAKGVKP